MHAVFFNIPYIKQDISSELWGYGFIKIKSIPVSEGYMAITYVLKYLAKENTLNDRISMPRGMIRPIVSYNLHIPSFTPIFDSDTFILEADVTITTALFKKQ